MAKERFTISKVEMVVFEVYLDMADKEEQDND